MAGGAVQTTTTYGPYGTLLAQTGSSGTVYGYTGEQEDEGTGLVYLRARYYNPEMMVFQSRDPFPGWIEMPASQNGYSYVHNNPIIYVDPSGNCYGPAAFLRQIEGGNCANLDMAMVIMNHPNATPSQKAAATAYGSTLVFGHLAGATGGAMLVHAAGTAATIGSGLAVVADSAVQTIDNINNGMSIGQAAYNINGAQVIGSGVAGAFTGGVGGKMFPFIAKTMGLAYGTGTSTAFGTSVFSSITSGAAINVTGGRIGEIVTNALTGCDPYYISDRDRYLSLAYWGGISGGASSLLDQMALISLRNDFSIIRNNVNNEAWDAMQKAGLTISQNDDWYWASITKEIVRRQAPVYQAYYAASSKISIIDNSDVWKAVFDTGNKTWSDHNSLEP